jgi:hypothetical protein
LACFTASAIASETSNPIALVILFPPFSLLPYAVPVKLKAGGYSGLINRWARFVSKF